MIQYQIKAQNAAELVRDVESAVAHGKLSAGQSLPSVRRLASQAGLSPATVASALAELRRRGVIVTEPRRGTRIGQAPLIASPMSSVPVPPGARDLSRGNPDPALLPDLSRVLERLHPPRRLYGEPAAVAELLALAREQLRADGIPGESLCVVSGALDGIERVLAAALRAGDRVAVENPGYAALFHLLRAHGLGLEPVEIDERGMLPESLAEILKRGVSAVVVTPRGQNPTGAALDGERARRLRGVLASAPGTLVIEDDHLGEVAGCELHSVTTACQRWASTRSVAKALGPDLRLAILAGDSESISRVQGAQACGPGWVSHILQRTVLALLSDPEVDALVRRARDIYSERRLALLDCLAAEGIGASAKSGLNVWVGVPEETSAVARLCERGWVVSPGVAYRLQSSPPAIRVTISTLERADAVRFARDLADVIRFPGSDRSG
jgi:DNA-binding transcriptional MocR family regulator